MRGVRNALVRTPARGVAGSWGHLAQESQQTCSEAVAGLRWLPTAAYDRNRAPERPVPPWPGGSLAEGAGARRSGAVGPGLRHIAGAAAPDEDVPPDCRDSGAGFEREMGEMGHPMRSRVEQRGRYLEKYGRDLTQEARLGLLDPVIGREAEITRVLEILLRRTKNNPLLLGDPGVGKTAVAEGVARILAGIDGACPPGLLGCRLVSIDVGSLVAGTQYRGSFEDRIRGIVEDVKRNTNVILFIDECHMVLSAGQADGGMNAANLLKPALARGELRCIAATTLQEYSQHLENDAAFARRLQKVMVEEPSVDGAVACLMGLRSAYEAHHRVSVSEAAIRAACEAAPRYLPGRRLPDSAIDIIDEAAAHLRLRLSVEAAEAAAARENDDKSKGAHAAAAPGPLDAAAGFGGAPAAGQTLEGWEEARRRRELLEWFGATPERPAAGHWGHMQTIEARKRKFLEIWGPGQYGTGGEGSQGAPGSRVSVGVVGDSEGSGSDEDGGSGGVGYAAAAAAAQSASPDPHNPPKPCPHCAYPVTPPEWATDATTLSCPSCAHRFLNVSPDKLIQGVVLQNRPEPSTVRRAREAGAAARGTLGGCTGSGGSCEAPCTQAGVAARDSVGTAEAAPLPELTVEAVWQAVGRVSGVPVAGGASAEGGMDGKLADLREVVAQSIVGQDEAVGALVDLVRAGHLQLGARGDAQRPAAALAVRGPVGVGKSTACRLLGEELYGGKASVLRVDMAEFAQASSVAKLIGAPPGYIGHSRGGLLTEAVRQRPYSLILLDNFDRAHPDIATLFAHILDTGGTTDSLGRPASFLHATIVLSLDDPRTTEVAPAPGAPSRSSGDRDSGDSSAELSQPAGDLLRREAAACGADVGGGPGAEPPGPGERSGTRRAGLSEAILARLDGVVTFRDLGPEEMRAVVARECGKLAGAGSEGRCAVEVSPAVQAWVASQAAAVGRGAAPVAGLLRRWVLSAAARAVVESGAAGAGRVERVRVEMGAQGKPEGVVASVAGVEGAQVVAGGVP
ncbi:unnamed protein product [Pedinophyceae sp. YPF-701]|nr:unnamed protein product [Pedinophyceae sp. YPF-701]